MHINIFARAMCSFKVVNRPSHWTLAQKPEMMLLMVLGVSNEVKPPTGKMLSSHGVLAHPLMLSMYLAIAPPTGTHTTREDFCKSATASPVFITLNGLPSVITTTTEVAPDRPLISSVFASARAKDVSVVLPGHF